MTLRLDYSNMMISPGGIDQKAWGEAPKQFAALRGGGTVGFIDLARNNAAAHSPKPACRLPPAGSLQLISLACS